MCRICGQTPCHYRCPEYDPERDPQVTFFCDLCGEPQYEDACFLIDGKRICADCVRESREYL